MTLLLADRGISGQDPAILQPLNAVQETEGRPRLVMFRPLQRTLPAFVRTTLDDHVRCLRHFFEVSVVTENCDYDEICDRLRPDLALFESGVYVRPDRRISNTHRHRNVLKLGLLDADAYCLTRSVFLSDMDEWGVDQFFTISMSLSERLPHLRDRLYVWPNFADARRFLTYPGGKSTPILLAGSHATNYPWRSRVNRLLSDAFEVESIPHGGWVKTRDTKDMLVGEGYARALSASLIIPTCGTIAHELVRKHLEIPAAGSLLLTERTPAVEAAGFVDMETCVFADEADVVDKTRFLLSNPDLIERISSAGQRLAHTRHDLANRDQILQWFTLTRSAKPGEAVVQTDPFGKMSLAVRRRETPRMPEIVVGRDRALIRAAEAAAKEGRVQEARSGFLAASNFHYQAEIGLGMARLHLQEGDAKHAVDWIWDSISRCTRGHGAATPDPVEWSVYLLGLLCAGKLRQADAAADCYSEITNDELARMRHLVHRLNGRRVSNSVRRRRLSIHQTRDLSWPAWTANVVELLTACGQLKLAQQAAELQNEREPPEEVASEPVVAGPRKVGRRPWSLRYRRPLPRFGVRSWLSRKGILPARTVARNPFSELLEGRALQTMIVIGFSPGDPAVLQAREACRHSPERCALVTIGDLRCRDAGAEELVSWGSDALFGSAPHPFSAGCGDAIVVAPANFAPIRDYAYFGARMVALVGAVEISHSSLVREFSVNTEWRRATLSTSPSAYELAAWERIG